MRISDWNSDVCSSDLAEVPHQLLHARLGLGRERDLDIALPQRLAGLVLDGAEPALPARLLFLLSAHLPAVEIEMFLRKGLAQVGRGGIEQMGAQVGRRGMYRQGTKHPATSHGRRRGYRRT